MDAAFGLVLTIWVFVLFEPGRFLTSLVPALSLIKVIPTLLLVPALVVIFLQGTQRAVYWPLVGFVILHTIGVPLATNRGLAMVGFKKLFRIGILFTATAATGGSPLRALRFLQVYFLSFLYYAIQGLPDGRVSWHNELGNKDGFAPMAVMGLAFAYYFAMGARDRLWRWLGFLTASLCLVGVVASMARGAALACAAVLILFWVRSKSKLRLTAAAIAAGCVMLIVVEVVHPDGKFWAEMRTIAEGTSEGTGRDRYLLWQVGWIAFKQSPVIGVGANCAGVAAAKVLGWGELTTETKYRNPETLYNRPLHNMYVQILAEQGIIGIGLLAYVIFDFYRRMRRLRRRESVATFGRAVGGRFDLEQICLGLETTMTGYLLSAFFYNQFYNYWLFSMLTLSFILTEAVRTRPAPRRSPPPRPHGAPVAPAGRPAGRRR